MRMSDTAGLSEKANAANHTNRFRVTRGIARTARCRLGPRVPVAPLACVAPARERRLDPSLLAGREVEGALLHVRDDAFNLNAPLETPESALEVLVRMYFNNGQTVSPPFWPEWRNVECTDRV